MRTPRFRNAAPRVLVFTSGYFLQRDIASACARLGWPCHQLELPRGGLGSTAFVESLLGAAAAFRPDFAITVNHLGLDSRGMLLELLGRMALPLASWFVDSPRLILHDFPNQPSPWCQVFAWDADTVAPLESQGFENVRYLPLATDTSLFRPDAPPSPAPAHAPAHAPEGGASFVGDSMLRPVERLRRRLARHGRARDLALSLAPDFAASPARSALEFMRAESPDLAAAWEALPQGQPRLDLEQLLTWEATRLYRLERVRALLPCAPLLAGDDGWRALLPPPAPGLDWRLAGPLDYTRDLPGFYAGSGLNFNATSLQMKGAVNQRVFDVPACGAFLLTDEREQLPGLFEPGAEVVCYGHPGEVADMARHYLAHPGERQKIADAARRRVLAEHDYTHRMKVVLKVMRRRYA
ncbi:CgeB family protein [Fundidesulfovibrio agrisoli]|uniref:CgeB family protein n=1 Tax=Fundidesulfovibrio agrisoli TaxID=2922717 RepID=UPI001FAD0718